jgi:hypothetical protein
MADKRKRSATPEPPTTEEEVREQAYQGPVRQGDGDPGEGSRAKTLKDVGLGEQ